MPSGLQFPYMSGADQALSWLARTRDRIDGSGVPEANKPRSNGWIDYEVAGTYLTKTEFGADKTNEEAAHQSTSRLEVLLQLQGKRPGVQAERKLIDTHLFRNQFESRPQRCLMLASRWPERERRPADQPSRPPCR
jgi:hypothetical protein